jgi:hypothetical protein
MTEIGIFGLKIYHLATLPKTTRQQKRQVSTNSEDEVGVDPNRVARFFLIQTYQNG